MPPSTPEIIILAIWGLTYALVLIFIFVLCCQRGGHLSSEDIETSVGQTQAWEKQQEQGEASRPVMVVYKNDLKTESKCTDCVICLEEFKDGDSCKILSNCKHVYHKKCIDQWLVKNSHCPLCFGSVHKPTADQNQIQDNS